MALFILGFTFMMACNGDGENDPGFDLPEPPPIPERFLIREDNRRSSRAFTNYTYNGAYITNRLNGVFWEHEFEYNNGRMVRESAIPDPGTNEEPDYILSFTHQSHAVIWTDEDYTYYTTKTWTSPTTYEEVLGNIENGEEVPVYIIRYVVEDFKPISSVRFTVRDGVEKESVRTTYTYDQKVINPLFGRYGKDSFQPLYLPTKKESFIASVVPGNDWFLASYEYWDYELDEDHFPIIAELEYGVYDTGDESTTIEYYYR